MDQSSPSPTPGRRVTLVVETPRGSFVKRDLVDGRLRVAFVSPVPCPFDYGHVPGERANDGMARDAIWLGPRRRAFETAEGVVAGIVRFQDGGAEDDKWIVTPDGRLDDGELARIGRFFRLYAAIKRAAGKGSRFGGTARVEGTPPA